MFVERGFEALCITLNQGGAFLQGPLGGEELQGSSPRFWLLGVGLGTQQVDVAGKLAVPASACPGALAVAVPKRPSFGPGMCKKPHLGKCHAGKKKKKAN